MAASSATLQVPPPLRAMNANDAGPDRLSTWFLASLDTTQEAEGALRNVLLDLRHLLQADALEHGTRTQLERMLAGLEQTAGSLALLQSFARGALDEVLERSANAARPKGRHSRPLS